MMKSERRREGGASARREADPRGMVRPVAAATKGVGLANDATTEESSALSGELRDLPKRSILGVRVDATSQSDAVDRIVGWARGVGSKYVCVANVHSVMEAHDDEPYLRVLNEADLVTPDGMPLVWGLRLLGVKGATRVSGPTLMPALLEACSRAGVSVGFYGSTPEVLEQLDRRLRGASPDLTIAFSESPPFHVPSQADDARTVQEINASGTRLLFVGLGCPKQERWMAEHRGTVDAVMIGVGAAFDFLAGNKRRAPEWMQRWGLEWTFRLATEPRRLWRRYLYRNPRFMALFTYQLLHDAVAGRRDTLR